MPGSFLLDSPIPPHLDLVGAPSPLFQVPPTPSASSALYRSISISQHRKRSYPESDSHRFSLLQTPYNPRTVIGDIYTDLDDQDDDPHQDDDYNRPSRYRDLPRPPLDASLMKESDVLRRKRCRREDPSLVVAASPSGVDEKSPEQLSDPAGPVRWSRAVLNVVGKVWDFCWSGPFRGFYAGGGRGYPIDPPPLSPSDDHHRRRRSQPSPHLSQSDLSTFPSEKQAISLPGEYPNEREEDLHGNWVMVSPREGDVLGSSQSPCARSRPRRRVALPRAQVRTTTTSQTRRRPGNSSNSGPSKRALTSHPSSSFASPAKPRESPVSVETQRYLAQKRRMEREEDASLRRLNRQLQAMIQEGKQALGTKVEVDDIDMMDD